jgi:hypothetical protein
MRGARGKTPWLRQDHLSIGAKMHISSNANTSLSIKNPLHIRFLEGKKKGRGVITPSAQIYRSINRMESFVLAKKLYHKK